LDISPDTSKQTPGSLFVSLKMGTETVLAINAFSTNFGKNSNSQPYKSDRLITALPFFYFL
jgi:hypothetical protein